MSLAAAARSTPTVDALAARRRRRCGETRSATSSASARRSSAWSSSASSSSSRSSPTFIAPYDPNTSMLDLRRCPGERGAPPCIHLLGCPADQPQHLMGLDGNLRDVFSRVVHGARVSLLIGFVTVGFAIVIGTFIGAIAGFAGGAIGQHPDAPHGRRPVVPEPAPGDRDRHRPRDGPDQRACSPSRIVSIPIYARVMRASVLSVRETDFVTASRALGESSRGILRRRILPNALTPLIVAGHARHRRRDPRGRRAVVRRPRRPAADRRVGRDDRAASAT